MRPSRSAICGICVSLKQTRAQRKGTQLPDMTYEPRSYNDKSALTDGWHPAFLLTITDEPTPETWKMYAKSPRLWRWQFAVWAKPEDIPHMPPERQTTPSAQKFTPKGNQPASKAYLWTCELLGRQVPPGEHVNLDPLMPLPCRVKVSRNNEYANIMDLEAWVGGSQYLTPDMRVKLQQLLDNPASAPAGQPSTQSPAHTSAAAAYATTQPGMGQVWGTPAPQPATPGKGSW